MLETKTLELLKKYFNTYLMVGSLVNNQLFPDAAFMLKDSCVTDVDISILNLKQKFQRVCVCFINEQS